MAPRVTLFRPGAPSSPVQGIMTVPGRCMQGEGARFSRAPSCLSQSYVGVSRWGWLGPVPLHPCARESQSCRAAGGNINSRLSFAYSASRSLRLVGLALVPVPSPVPRCPADLLFFLARKGNHMTRSVLVSLALVALISISTRKAEASVATPSLSQARAYALVEKAGVDYCYWKPKKNGQWKLKCED
jgi:hypothetical protein